MSSRRKDGLSIAVWENSPWRAFIRFRDPDNAEAGNDSQQFRSGKDIGHLHVQSNDDDVREIFGRALDATRSKKAFVSAAQIRMDVTKSEARLMAEDNRRRANWNGSGDASSYGLDDDSFEDDDDEDSSVDMEHTEDHRQTTENYSGHPSRNGSIRAARSPHPQQGISTACGAVDDSDFTAEWGIASTPRTPTRLQPLMLPAGESLPQMALTRHSPQGAPSGGSRPYGDNNTTSGGIAMQRARAAVAARAMAHSGGCSSVTLNAKLLHVHAANMPARSSMDLHCSRKLLSSTLSSLHRSNSFDGGRHDGTGAAVGPAAAVTAAAATNAALTTQDRASLLPLANAQGPRENRAATTNGSLPSYGVQSGGSGAGSSSSCSNVELHVLQLQQQQQQRDATLMRSRSRRATLLPVGMDDGRVGGADGGGSSSGGSGNKHPTLGPSLSSRMLEPHGLRPHAVHPPPSRAPSLLSPASLAASASTSPLASSSYGQLVLPTSPLGDVRKHPASASVPGACGSESVRHFGGYNAFGPSSPPAQHTENRCIMGPLRGIFTPQ